MKACFRPMLQTALLLCCILLLGLMVWKAGPQHLWQTLCQLPLTIAFCIAVWGVGYLLNAASFREVLLGMGGRVGWLSVLRVTVTGYALNYITPFGLLGGEPYRVWVLKERMGTQRATQGVVLYSMMHVASHLLFWLLAAFVATGVALLTRSNTGIGRKECLGAAALMLLCVGLLWLFWRLYRRGVALRFMSRWVSWALLDPSLLAPGRFVRALLFELMSRLVNVVEYWLVMQALGYANFSYADAFLVVAFSSLLANALFFAPMQLGTREGGILLALQYLLPGQLLGAALTLSFATRIREFFWIAVGLAIAKRK